MPLWIQPIFGNLIEIPFSPPIDSWRSIYNYLHFRYFSDKKLHQLHLFHNNSSDLSNVSDGEILHLIVSDLMVERWISECSIHSKQNDNIQYHHSTLSWCDARWGNPYEDLTIQYRTQNICYIIVKEIKDCPTQFRMTLEYIHRYDNEDTQSDILWYTTLREACYEFRKILNMSQEIMTEKTCDNIIHLWDLYHGTNQHLFDQGRCYDY